MKQNTIAETCANADTKGRGAAVDGARQYRLLGKKHVILRGTIVNRTYGTHKTLYI